MGVGERQFECLVEKEEALGPQGSLGHGHARSGGEFLVPGNTGKKTMEG